MNEFVDGEKFVNRHLDMPNPEHKTSTLVNIAIGDREAFEHAFHTYWEKLYNLARKILDDDVAAQDVVQDVFVNLWERAKQSHILNLEAYLHQAVKYACFMHMRSGKISAKHIERLQIIAHATSQVVRDPLEIEELETSIQKEIDNLPQKCREVFYLSRFQELSHQEIARQLNISLKTVENHMTKALRLLRVSIEKIVVLLLVLLS
jgi:RNA polymerase sigma-70 factor (ECF subfamily)